jgi:predicted nucleotidyltransferase
VTRLLQIRGFAQEVARQYRPEKIVLFGSHGRGEAGEDSDVDLLVIMDFNGRPSRQALEIRRTVKKSFPLDLIIKSPAEAKMRLEQGDSFLAEALSTGQVLYEAR